MQHINVKPRPLQVEPRSHSNRHRSSPRLHLTKLHNSLRAHHNSQPFIEKRHTKVCIPNAKMTDRMCCTTRPQILISCLPPNYLQITIGCCFSFLTVSIFPSRLQNAYSKQTPPISSHKDTQGCTAIVCGLQICPPASGRSKHTT